MGFFSKISEGLKKTRDSMRQRIDQVVKSFAKIDEELFEELEETLVMSDVGVVTAQHICERLRERVKAEGVTDAAQVREMIKEIVTEMLSGGEALKIDTQPSVVLVIGVNGAGKTTMIGKLAHILKGQGKKVLVAAADTFRAAAIDQLEVWTQRAGVEIIKTSEGSDPASVVYDAIAAGKARKSDVILVDTAGRLHNKKNLMDELAKIHRIIRRELPDSDLETLLVLDGTTGQNAISQARLFSEATDITGIVLTKLDGTAKGGVVIGIREELKIPVKYIGVGEQIEDLQPFDAKAFADALFEDGGEQQEEQA